MMLEVLSDAKGCPSAPAQLPHAQVAHCPHMASHFSRAQSGMNSLLTTYGKGDLLPHKLFLSSSFPETWMDFILINGEAWALQAQREVGGELWAWIGEGKGKSTGVSWLLMCRRGCHGEAGSLHLRRRAGRMVFVDGGMKTWALRCEGTFFPLLN